jgi:LuxR family maltose regulon positive regulatory protein
VTQRRRINVGLAKLTPPRVHRALMRNRLLAYLDEARTSRRMICVVGPPGAGKSTLIASWLAAVHIRSIWYQVDPGDADLPTFFYYLGQAVLPFSSGKQPPMPVFSPEYQADPSGFARRFFRELFARLKSGSVLVLDNYQDVGDGPVFHEIIAQAAREVPDGVIIIAISRHPLPNWYARVVAEERAVTISWEALKLTFDEARAIVGVRVSVAPDVIEQLHQLSEGWAAGLMLLIEHLQQGAPVDALSRPPSLDAIFNYFADQLFARVSERTQQLLLRLSYLPGISADRAVELTDDDGAGKLLDQLHRRHLFTECRAAAHPVYHFHALLLAFLQHRAAVVLPLQEQLELTRRAARILDQAGRSEEAFARYIASGEIASAQALILREAPSLISQGRWQVVVHWIESLPHEYLARQCWLIYWLGAARVVVAPMQAREILERSHAVAVEVKDELCALQAAAGVIQTHMLLYEAFRPLDAWIEEIQMRLQRLPRFTSVDAEARVYSALLVALSYRRPDEPALDLYAERLQILLPQVSDINLRATATAYLLAWATTTGPVEFAPRMMHALQTILQAPGLTAFNAGWCWFLISWYHCLHGNYLQCKEALSELEKIAHDYGLPSLRKFSALIGAWLEMNACNAEAAQGWLVVMEKAANSGHLFDRAGIDGIKGWLAVLRNEPQAALRSGDDAVNFFDRSGSLHHRINYRLTGIWAEVMMCHWDNARARILDMRQLAARTRSFWPEIALRATEACIALEMGDGALAKERVQALLSLAREHGQHHAFAVQIRPWMSRLCELALESDIEAPYVRTLIARFGWRAPASRPAHWAWPVIVHTLGGFQLLINGKPASYSRKAPKKPLSVLKVMVAQGGQRVAQRQVIDALWPDEDGDRGHQSLTIALQRLRRLLGNADAIIATEGTLSFDRDLVWVDIEAFEELVKGPAVSTNFSRLAAIYRGPFLSDELDALWAMPARERLRTRFLQVVERFGQVLEQEAAWSQASDVYLRGLEGEPLAEVLYQGLMRCNLATGRHADGANLYRRMRQMFLSTNVSPSRESERLYRLLAAG